MIVPTVFSVFILKTSTKCSRQCCFIITEKLNCRKLRRRFSWPPRKVIRGQELKPLIQPGPSHFLSSLLLRKMGHSISHPCPGNNAVSSWGMSGSKTTWLTVHWTSLRAFTAFITLFTRGCEDGNKQLGGATHFSERPRTTSIPLVTAAGSETTSNS